MDSTYLPFGLRSDGNMVAVADVERGRACDCVCPACGEPLVARKGDVREHHFAHYAGGSACEGGVETAIHQMAKQILVEDRRIHVPGLRVYESMRTDADQVIEEVEEVFAAHWLSFDSVIAEQREDARRPDIIGRHGDETLLIEIAVTNPTVGRKRAEYEDGAYPVLEIALPSASEEITKSELHEQVIESLRSKHWLAHPRTEMARKQARQRLLPRIEEANQEEAKRRQQEQEKKEKRHSKIRAAPSAEQRQPESSRSVPPMTRFPEVEYDPRWFVCDSCRHIWTVPLSEAPYTLRTIRCPECDFNAFCDPFVRD